MEEEKLVDQKKKKEEEQLNGALVRVLGSGAYGVVYLMKIWSSVDEGFVAVKRAEEKHSSSLRKELEIYQHLKDCRNVVRCFGGSNTVEDDGTKMFNLVLEYAKGGTLLDLMEVYGGRIPESDIKWYTRKILQGLVDIHEKGYVHSDLKPENILVFTSEDDSEVETVKIADFGLAKRNGIDRKVWPYGFRGTPHYMSPESILGKISGALDIWSLGCVVLEMITGKSPWPYRKLYVLSHKLLGGEIPAIPNNMSDMGKSFLMKCFNLDQDERWTASMLLNHPYLLPHQTISQISASFLDYSSALISSTQFEVSNSFAPPTELSSPDLNACMLEQERRLQELGILA